MRRALCMCTIAWLLPYWFTAAGATPRDSISAARADSLRAVLEERIPDSTRCMVYLQLANCYAGTDPHQALDYYYRAEYLAEREELYAVLGKIRNHRGIYHLNECNYREAAGCFARAIRSFGAVGDTPGQARAFNNLGITYRRWGKFREAAAVFAESLRLYKLVGDGSGIAMVCNNLGSIYSQFGEHHESLRYFTEFLDYSRQFDDSLAVANGHNNVGVGHYELHEYQKALEHFYAALQIYDSLHHQHGVAITSDNIGLMLSQLHQYRDAIGYQQRAYAIFLELHDRLRQATVLGNISAAYRNGGERLLALRSARRGLHLADSLGNDELKAQLQEEVAHSYWALDSVRQAVSHYDSCLTTLKGLLQAKGRDELRLLEDNHGDLKAILAEAEVDDLGDLRQEHEGRSIWLWAELALGFGFLLGLVASRGWRRVQARKGF